MGLTFKKIYDDIEAFHKVLGYDYSIPRPAVQEMQELRNIAVALNQEVAELVNSFPWKPWRRIEDQPYDKENAIEEVVDIIFFLVEFCEAAHISSYQIEKKFMEKLGENYSRILRQYNNTAAERGGDASGQ